MKKMFAITVTVVALAVPSLSVAQLGNLLGGLSGSKSSGGNTGADLGAQQDSLVRNYVAAGGSILFHSTEIPELVHMSDRVLVLYDGRVAAELAGEAITEPAIMRPALGHGAVREEAAA